MARITPLPTDAMTPEQREVHDTIAAGPRGAVYGPLAIWLHRPAFAARAQALGQYCRFDSGLAPHLSELAILVTARVWGAEFEWWAHEKYALQAGISPGIIEAIRTRLPPALEDPEQQAVYDVATELNATRLLADTTYARAEQVLGQGRLIDLVGLLGYYTLISMTLNAFQVDVPGGALPRLS